MNNLSILNTFRTNALDNKSIEENDWNTYQKNLFELGLGMEETLHFLFTNRPNSEEFENWIYQNKVIYENSDMDDIPDVLNEEDLAFWNKNGYVVLRKAITTEDCLETQQAIYDFLGAGLDNPDSWYKNHESKEGLMVLLTKHPSLEKNRASKIIKKAYQQLYKTDDIYMVIDKVSFNPPENENFKFRGSPLHWDVSLDLPIPFKLQGLLYLTDVNENSGAFHCVPGFQHEIENWIGDLPSNVNPREEAVKSLKSVPVLGKAGDFVIWHQALPHCASPNTSTSPRMVQYLTYFPIKSEDKKQIWI